MKWDPFHTTGPLGLNSAAPALPDLDLRDRRHQNGEITRRNHSSSYPAAGGSRRQSPGADELQSAKRRLVGEVGALSVTQKVSSNSPQLPTLPDHVTSEGTTKQHHHLHHDLEPVKKSREAYKQGGSMDSEGLIGKGVAMAAAEMVAYASTPVRLDALSNV
ncbi:unnamed protein product [Peronospora belbahrii]|uniref:Uncharacterized protein n=1 Tax=Peronospora belbahrii TaxID=622444 RepID=A0AAU9KVL8_9STRA|nr:unnamed protein product [Peronospora belbahrii]CAH0518735.1 unnamed protein product [Peronospora belbahrii]